MNEDVIRMAREAGFSEQDGIVTGGASDLERFAALVAAATIEKLIPKLADLCREVAAIQIEARSEK